MKKSLIVIITIAVIILGLAFAVGYYFKNYNHIGADNYYVYIDKDGQKETSKDSTGETFVQYKYTLMGYNKNGDSKELAFTAQKNLRNGAYLKIYYKKDKGVTSYEEVSKNDLPEKASAKLAK
ncbi:hypothetical protein MFLO_04130 [Listeria floridensis FSL S10-1187]|uniref:YxeA family protein n=1 Tax=Listeria floridensis FSL S10-1187 TaxID=1265817 RepID=A0ABN0RHB3_9LIST|nr:YxeA family protein [Listeria floridensis]EUJ33296.1 hypothetical protein MFLO_04130 [Listeria floridensis FSL S10-1187]